MSSYDVTSSSPPALLLFRACIDLGSSSVEIMPIVTSNMVMGVCGLEDLKNK